MSKTSGKTTHQSTQETSISAGPSMKKYMVNTSREKSNDQAGVPKSQDELDKFF